MLVRVGGGGEEACKLENSIQHQARRGHYARPGRGAAEHLDRLFTRHGPGPVWGCRAEPGNLR